MLEGDYEIYMVADASGGTSVDAHNYAMDRMVQAGVVPMTWQQVLLEWQRDWARKDTYDQTIAIVQEHSGAYGTRRGSGLSSKARRCHRKLHEQNRACAGNRSGQWGSAGLSAALRS